MNVQALMDAISAGSRATRANYHLTLGKLIAALESADSTTQVRYDIGDTPCTPHSYRGYYEDLAFESDTAACTVADFLKVCRDAHGKTFEGYKGGDFVMDDGAILWLATYGSSGGRAIVGTEMTDDSLVLLTREVDL